MLRIFAVCIGLVLAGTAAASLSGVISAWGHDFVVTPFEPREMMVAEATDRASGARFNIVKMPSGRIMALVPMDAMKEPPSVAPKDLM